VISLENVTKVYRGHGLENQVLVDVNMLIEKGESLGICGANGAGKSTLLRLIAGVERPTSGRIHRTMSTSWPIGYASAFQGGLTGADNAKFVARVHGRDEGKLLDYVEDFAQLGSYLYQPVKTYSAGMAARLAFAVSLAIDFDCYIIDEITGAGDERFRARSEQALLDRRERSTLIMVSHDTQTLFRYCSRGAVVFGGGVALYETIEEAADVHHRLQSFPPQPR